MFNRSTSTDPRTQLQARLDSERISQQSNDTESNETGFSSSNSTTLPHSTRSSSPSRPIFGGSTGGSSGGSSSGKHPTSHSASKLRLVR